MNGKIVRMSCLRMYVLIDIEGAALRVLSYLNDTDQHHLASLANEKRKVTVIGEEHEPNEFVWNLF